MVSLGDCAVTGNVPAMRNVWEVEALFQRAYVENAQWPESAAERKAKLPVLNVPKHERIARPLHEIIEVDVYVPGCPPPADAIWFVLTELLAGRIPEAGATALWKMSYGLMSHEDTKDHESRFGLEVDDVADDND